MTAGREYVSHRYTSKYCSWQFAFVIISFVLGACVTNPYVQGERLYEYHCSGCHMSDGSGMAQLYPPVAGADYLENHLEHLPCMIVKGLRDTIVVNGITFQQPMDGIKGLTAAEIANISNYISFRWYGQARTFSESSVTKQLATCTNRRPSAF